ncbi:MULTISPECIES: non-ribosomal peptide synthetase [Pseudomonas]|uniref:Amino acid adenylation domain-containing protein n=1 Tax=Pseudomonas mosselii TaxID=78327 RepID=A0A5R8ZHF8_9PSED|nr:non-ribosomal peptide synthetase [Pseudomonas mosselii]TLP65200.1 amino acid adenylation domain-containing protein [Pseudomonas mosselii]
MMDLGLPLSPAQKQLAEANPQAYRWVRMTLTGVAPEQVEQRLREALEQHDALRLRYLRPHGATGLRQRVVAPHELRLDWRQAGAGSDVVAWQRDAQAQCQTQQPDLLAWWCDQQLWLALPACSLDLHSLEQLRGKLLGQGTPGEAEPMQYSDYADWITGLQLDEDAEQGVQFWRNLALQEVPGMRLIERYGMASGARGCVQQALDPALCGALKALAAGEALAIEPLALAAWGALLARLNGQRHAQLGLQHDPRDDYEQLQGAFGLFEQTLPMQVHVSEHASWVSLARQLARQLENAVLWQEYLGQAELLPEWRASYQAGLRVQHLADIKALQALSFDTPVELQLHWLLDDAGQGQLALTYDSGLYRREQMQLLLRRYVHWIGQLLQAPQAPLDGLDALLAEEAQPTALDAELPADVDIIERLRAHARHQPHSPALRDGRQLLSYAEVDALSDRVAGSLQQAGVGPDQVVALLLPRGAQMLIAMLACFKAGAAYLPLDPALPPLRLASILEDCQPALVLQLDESGQVCELPSLSWSQASSAEPLATPVASAPQHLAYVLYTSGTSGKPKGVQIEQGQLRHYASRITHALNLPAGAHYGLVSSLLADLGNTVLYPAWLQGGCVHLLSQASVTDAQAFADELREHPLDVLKIVPSHLEALIGEHPLEGVLPRQVLVLGGEAVSESLLARLAQAGSGCRLYNHYGPSETTVGVLWRAIDSEQGISGTALNQVLGNNRIYLLDEQQRPVPGGQAGELCVAGASVGRGYLGDVGSSAFGQDRHSGARLYRTGDLALRQADGALRILGRNDQQVKIRGFRLELAEVEQALRGVQGVQQAAVLLDGERLLAFIVEQPGQGRAEHLLRDDLAQQLPEYMLPAGIFALKTLPLNSNGKLDRQALLERARQRLQGARVAPVGELESAVLDIWCRVLGVEDLGVTDNFFAIGGHSLAAIKVVALIREQLGLHPPTNLLFERQTVRELVQGLDQGASSEGWQVLNDAAGDAPALLLVHGADGNLKDYRTLLAQLGQSQAVYGLTAFDEQWQSQDMDRLLQRYVQSIPESLKQRPLVVLGWCLASRLALLLIAHLQSAGFNIMALAAVDHDPQRSLIGDGDEGGQLLADLVFLCRSRSQPLGDTLRERLARQLVDCDYAEGVSRLLADAEVREHLQWHGAEAELQAAMVRYRTIKTRLYEQALPVVDVPIWLWRSNAHRDLRAAWQTHTRAAVRDLSLDVGHHAILAEPRLSADLLSLLAPSTAPQHQAEKVPN